MSVVSGGQVEGRPRLGWMDCVKAALSSRRMTVEAARMNCLKAALSSRGMTVEAARMVGRSGEPCYTCRCQFCLVPVLFRTNFPLFLLIS